MDGNEIGTVESTVQLTRASRTKQRVRCTKYTIINALILCFIIIIYISDNSVYYSSFTNETHKYHFVFNICIQKNRNGNGFMY